MPGAREQPFGPEQSTPEQKEEDVLEDERARDARPDAATRGSYGRKQPCVDEYADVEGTDLKFPVERLGYICCQAFNSPMARDVDPSLLVEPPHQSATP